jgi:hypothetical protein
VTVDETAQVVTGLLLVAGLALVPFSFVMRAMARMAAAGRFWS